jgi:hypothetical protein
MVRGVFAATGTRKFALFRLPVGFPKLSRFVRL